MIFKPAAGGVVFVLMFAASRVALAQNGMMNGGGWMSGYGGMGGYGGILVPILLVVGVAGVVLWFVKQKGK